MILSDEVFIRIAGTLAALGIKVRPNGPNYELYGNISAIDIPEGSKYFHNEVYLDLVLTSIQYPSIDFISDGYKGKALLTREDVSSFLEKSSKRSDFFFESNPNQIVPSIELRRRLNVGVFETVGTLWVIPPFRMTLTPINLYKMWVNCRDRVKVSHEEASGLYFSDSLL